MIMTEEDKTRFAGIMRAVALSCDFRLDKVTIKHYFKVLRNFGTQQVWQAAQKIIITWKYPKTFPPVAVFIENIQGTKKEIEDHALREADKIISHLNRFGARKFPPLEDPVSMFLMKNRWPYHRWAANITDAELKWWAKEFIEAYRAHSQNEKNPLLEAPEELKQLSDNLFKKIK